MSKKTKTKVLSLAEEAKIDAQAEMTGKILDVIYKSWQELDARPSESDFKVEALLEALATSLHWRGQDGTSFNPMIASLYELVNVETIRAVEKRDEAA